MSGGNKLDIVIVNWNAGPGLRECLQSINESNRQGYALDRVVVVDNASTDGSADVLAGLDVPLTVIRNAENRGFAAACNQGAQGTQADCILFLNPDTRLSADTLSQSICWMSRPEGEKTGVLGVQLVDEKGVIARTCARFPQPYMFVLKMLGLHRILRKSLPEHFYTEWDHRDSRNVDQVMGAYFLVRCPLFEALGGFDERYFVYFEEVDLCLRAKRAGWGTYFFAGAQCFHRGCVSSDQIKARRLLYSLQSRILYGYKNFSRGKARGLMLATIMLEPISRTLEGLLRLSPGRIGETIHGYWLLWCALPGILRKAKGVT